QVGRHVRRPRLPRLAEPTGQPVDGALDARPVDQPAPQPRHLQLPPLVLGDLRPRRRDVVGAVPAGPADDPWPRAQHRARHGSSATTLAWWAANSPPESRHFWRAARPRAGPLAEGPRATGPAARPPVGRSARATRSRATRARRSELDALPRASSRMGCMS